MPGRIFISYRRDDVFGDARGIRDGLATKFGRANVFMDVDSLLPGQRFDEELARALDACDVMLVVIGPRWSELLAARMVHGEQDYVRREIAEALRRRIVVIPVRVGREGQMQPLPSPEKLPEDIRELVFHQRHDVAQDRFARDLADLVRAIVAVRKRLREKQRAEVPRRTWYPWSRWILPVFAIGGLALALSPRVGEWLPLGLRDDSQVEMENSVRIRQRRDGWFMALAEANGVALSMLVDTTAPAVVLRSEDGQRLGFDIDQLDYLVPVRPGNEVTYAAKVTIDALSVGRIKIRNVDALVAKRGALRENLLGMSFLNRLNSYEFSGPYLTLRKI
jgi:aspartyl protease family protein